MTSLIKNKRLSITVLLVWIFIVLSVFGIVGSRDDNSSLQFTFGPSAKPGLLGISISTWGAWWGLVLFSCIDVAINIWATESIEPWADLEVYNPKEKSLEYPRWQTIIIVDIYYTYRDEVRPWINVYLALTQLDILLMRALTSIAVTSVTAWAYVRGRTPIKFLSDEPPLLSSIMISDDVSLQHTQHSAPLATPVSYRLGDDIEEDPPNRSSRPSAA